MKRLAFISFILVFCLCTKVKAQTDERSIEQTIVNFLHWHKNPGIDSVNTHYAIVKDIPINKKFKRRTIDKKGVEKYLLFLKRSNYLSEAYLNNLRGYFYKIGEGLDRDPAIQKSAIIKIDGLDLDFILHTFEPEEILDFVDHGLFKQIAIVSNKAIAQFYIPDSSTRLLVTLTKVNEKWLIDDLGYYDPLPN